MVDTDFNTQVRETILHLLTEANRVPFLFVGSGISAATWVPKTGMACSNEYVRMPEVQ